MLVLISAACHTTAGPVIEPYSRDADMLVDTDEDEDTICSTGSCTVDDEMTCLCYIENQQRCSLEENAIERCLLGDSGCLGWVAETQCGHGEQCGLEEINHDEAVHACLQPEEVGP